MKAPRNFDVYPPNAPRSTPSSRVIDQDGREIGVASDQISRGPFRMRFEGLGGPLTREQRIARLEAFARLLDVAFVVPGTNVRYGIEGVIGLIPVVGDLIATALSLWLVREARALGAPWHVTARMLGNVAIDGAVGIVPVLGDAFDVAFKANMRNMRILRRWLDKEGRAGR